MNEPDKIKLVQLLTEHGKTLFAGGDPDVVGAALADLLAIWITSHHAENRNATSLMRARLMRFHIKSVRQLVALYSRKEITP